MKNRLLFLLTIVVCLYSKPISAQIPKIPAEVILENQISGKILSTGYTIKKEIKYEVYGGVVTSNSYVVKIIEYNEYGREKDVEILNKAGTTEQIIIYKYQLNGLPQRITRFHPTGEIIRRIELKYNQERFLLEKAEFDQYNNVINKVVFLTDKKENTLKEVYYYSPEKITKTVIYRYNNLENGNLLSLEEYNCEELLRYKKEIKYEEGRIVRVDFFNASGKLMYVHSYIYDTRGYLSNIKRKDSDGSVYDYYKVQHNTNGLKTGEIIYGDKGRIKVFTKFDYK